MLDGSLSPLAVGPAARGRLHRCGAQQAGDGGQREADDVADAAADALDEDAAGALDGVGAGLVQRLAGADVPSIDAPAAAGTNVTIVVTTSTATVRAGPHRDAGVDLVGPARTAAAASAGHRRRRPACRGSRRRPRRSCRRRAPDRRRRPPPWRRPGGARARPARSPGSGVSSTSGGDDPERQAELGQQLTPAGRARRQHERQARSAIGRPDASGQTRRRRQRPADHPGHRRRRPARPSVASVTGSHGSRSGQRAQRGSRPTAAAGDRHVQRRAARTGSGGLTTQVAGASPGPPACWRSSGRYAVEHRAAARRRSPAPPPPPAPSATRRGLGDVLVGLGRRPASPRRSAGRRRRKQSTSADVDPRQQVRVGRRVRPAVGRDAR